MSIRSVDLQTLYPKVPEAGRLQQARDESVQAAQQQFASQLAGKVEREAGQVKQAPQTRGSRIGEEGGEGGAGRQAEGEGRPRDQEAEAQAPEPTAPHALPGEPGQKLDLKA